MLPIPWWDELRICRPFGNTLCEQQEVITMRKLNQIVAMAVAFAAIQPVIAHAADDCKTKSEVKKPLGSARVIVKNDSSTNGIYAGLKTLDMGVLIKRGKQHKVYERSLAYGSNEIEIWLAPASLVDKAIAAGKSVEELVSLIGTKMKIKLTGQQTSNGKGNNTFDSATFSSSLKCDREWGDGQNRWTFTFTF
jgi:hypothetical protein